MNGTRRTNLKRFTDYEDQSTEDALVVPEDLTVLSDEELASLSTRAAEAFTTIYGDGTGLSADDLATLAGLTEGLTALQAETGTREAAAASRGEEAAALAAQVGLTLSSDGDTDPEPEAPEGGEAAPEEEPPAEEAPAEETPEGGEALARREVRVNLSSLNRRAAHRPAAPEAPHTPSIRDYALAAPDLSGFSNGQGMDFEDMGRAVDTRLAGYNNDLFAQAAASGRHIKQQFGVATIRKPFAEGLKISSDDQSHVDEVFARAVDQSRLEGGSLVASGGWCAPSEILYDLFEIESNDGLLSVPEVHVSRGGIKWTPGPTFQSIYATTGFFYTEAQDQAGNYNGSGGGSKPFVHVGCPAFQEARLNPDGLAITAGLLEQRGYPEVISRTIRGSLVAHNHLMAGRKIAAMVTGSTAVTMPSPQAGALGPVLTSIELQVEHYKHTHRMARATVLEAIFPFWVRGAVRSDLAKRLGTDLDPTAVSDAMINAWFNQRGVVPQFVYNWQDIAGTAASGFTSWPTSVQFLLYSAGTWVAGGSDIITLDTVYDSTLLGTNDYTALFTEEGWLMAKRGHDSRVVTVPIEPTGMLAAGVTIHADGTH